MIRSSVGENEGFGSGEEIVGGTGSVGRPVPGDASGQGMRNERQTISPPLRSRFVRGSASGTSAHADVRTAVEEPPPTALSAKPIFVTRARIRLGTRQTTAVALRPTWSLCLGTAAARALTVVLLAE